MTNSVIPMVDWGNGVLMMGVFVVICIILIGLLIHFMTGGSSSDKD